MNIEEMMNSGTFTVAGDTVNSTKYAYRIKHALLAAGYKVYAVGKELESLDDVPADHIEVLDLCINPAKGARLLEETHKPIGAVIIQPGAGDDSIRAILERRGIPYADGCVLRALEARGLYTMPS